MPGLDKSIIKEINPELAIKRIINDSKSDFIFAPHYAAVFKHVSEELWEETKTLLTSGRFETELPINIEVPKPSGLTRPGSILKPADRLMYQAIVDLISSEAEDGIDRSRVFSNVLLKEDPNFRMFEDSTTCWNSLKKAIRRYAEDDAFCYAIKADVANFFERLYQHVLINLLRSTNCSAGAVNCLEYLLSSWMEKNSHGILQGMFPSDFLGNFYLVGLDSNLEVKGVPSARYIDDIYIFFKSKAEALKGMTELCSSLRRDGLHLNDRKSRILESEQLIREETEIDVLFELARKEVAAVLMPIDWYGFQLPFEIDGDTSDSRITLEAVENLYTKALEEDYLSDKIDLFCLPYLAQANSTIAVERSLVGLIERPHLSKLYSSYLWRLSRVDTSISIAFEKVILDNDFAYEWQLMWPIGAFISLDSVSHLAVTKAFRLFSNKAHSDPLRAICAIFIAKHGNPGQRRGIIQQYGNESSDYVRAAILYSARYFATSERRNCIKAWGGHSRANSLIARAVQNIVGS